MSARPDKLIPEENLPGHHPPEEQDKPTVARLADAQARRDAGLHEFRFEFDPLHLALGAPFGITPWTTGAQLDDDRFAVRFGLWRLETPRGNITGAEVQGPPRWWRASGPPRLSFVDRGITFGTATAPAVCVRFEEPVRCVDPTGRWLRHPGATLTIDDPDELAYLLNR